jgi:hypothetical protein
MVINREEQNGKENLTVVASFTSFPQQFSVTGRGKQQDVLSGWSVSNRGLNPEPLHRDRAGFARN